MKLITCILFFGLAVTAQAQSNQVVSVGEKFKCVITVEFPNGRKIVQSHSDTTNETCLVGNGENPRCFIPLVLYNSAWISDGIIFGPRSSGGPNASLFFNGAIDGEVYGKPYHQDARFTVRGEFYNDFPQESNEIVDPSRADLIKGLRVSTTPERIKEGHGIRSYPGANYAEIFCRLDSPNSQR